MRVKTSKSDDMQNISLSDKDILLPDDDCNNIVKSSNAGNPGFHQKDKMIGQHPVHS
jgi:hypothetical protein